MTITPKKLPVSAPFHTEELQKLLLEEHSRRQRDLIVSKIEDDSERVTAAIYLLCNGSYQEIQRVAWVLLGVAQKNPFIVQDWLPVLISQLHRDAVPDALKRNILTILSFVPIPVSAHSEVIDIAFNYLSNSEESIAVRAFSMTILGNMCEFYPEMIPEVKEVLQLELEKIAPPGIKSRAQKVLSQLRKRHKA